MFLNEQLKKARLEKGLTQIDLAKKITELGKKTSNSSIANWESGNNKPDVDTLELICEILEKDGNYFFEDSVKYSKFNGITINVEGLSDSDIELLAKFANDFANYIRTKKNNDNADLMNIIGELYEKK